MTKRQEAKRTELETRFNAQGHMTVADLIELLKTGIIYLTPSDNEGIYLLVHGDCPRQTRI